MTGCRGVFYLGGVPLRPPRESMLWVGCLDLERLMGTLTPAVPASLPARDAR